MSVSSDDPSIIVRQHDQGASKLYYQGMNPTIIVRQHDQGASIPILIQITIHPLSTDGAIVI